METAPETIENGPELVETIDITLSQTELFTEVAEKTKVPVEEVESVMDAFIQMHLKKLKLI